MGVTRAKNRFGSTEPGYRDLQINVTFDDMQGVVGELQFHLASVHFVKHHGGGHGFFRDIRDMNGLDELFERCRRISAQAKLYQEDGKDSGESRPSGATTIRGVTH